MNLQVLLVGGPQHRNSKRTSFWGCFVLFRGGSRVKVLPPAHGKALGAYERYVHSPIFKKEPYIHSPRTCSISSIYELSKRPPSFSGVSVGSFATVGASWPAKGRGSVRFRV